MVTIDELNEHGLSYIIMFINDIVKEKGKAEYQNGMYIENYYDTPETCFWLYKLLKSKQGSAFVDDEVLEELKKGTNHPELLK